MRIVDRYIFRSLILVFLVTIVIFSLLFILIDSATNLDDFLGNKVSLSIILQFYLAYLPVVIVQTASIAALISALLVFSHLNSHNELIALRASGLTFWQITRPALVFAALVTITVLTINERYIPYTQKRADQIRDNNIVTAADKKKKQPVISNLTFYGLKNRLYFLDSFDPNTSKITGVTIIGYDDKQNIKEKVVALEGRWTGLAWKVYQCHVTNYAEGTGGPAPIRVYPEKLMDIQETPQDFIKQRLDIESMNIKQLQQYIERFSQSGARRAVTNLQIDMYHKATSPFSTMVIVLVGLPLAMANQRRKAQNFTALALAIAIGFSYYVFNAVGLALGKGGVIYPPVLAVLVAPVIFLTLAGYLIKTKF